MLAQFLLLFTLFFPMVCALAGWLIGKKNERIRNIFDITINTIEFWVVCLLYFFIQEGPIHVVIPDVMGAGLFLKLDKLRYIFVFLTAFIWLLTTYYSTYYLTKYKNRNRYFAFFTLTLSSTIGIFISQDLINLFTFFELMSFSSYLLVIHDEDQFSHKAGASYIAAAVIGGLFLLMGLFLLYDYAGTLNIDLLPAKVVQMGGIKYVIAVLMLIGFGVKAGMVPLHAWLPQAYAAAPSSASAILSGILSKTGVFGILVVSVIIMQGDIYISTALVVLGFMTMLTGGLLAVLQKPLKRILAYSSMSQVGYIIAGIGVIGLLGEHGAIAVYGTILFLINHTLFKGMLFLCSGIINRSTHEQNINLLKGFGRHRQLLKFAFFIGMIGITGMPGFVGFAGKTLLHEALVETRHLYHSSLLWVAELLFIICSALTVIYMLKIFITLFVEKGAPHMERGRKYKNSKELIPPMIISACILLMGPMTKQLLAYISGSMKYLIGHESTVPIELYSANSVSTAIGILLLGIGGFAFVLRKFLRRMVDGERVYFNPIPNHMNLEDLFYIPFGKLLYKSGLALFTLIDTAIMQPAEWITTGLQKLSEISVPRISLDNIHFGVRRDRSSRPVNEGTQLVQKGIELENKAEESLKTMITGLRSKFNSIIYAVFIFATALVMIMIVLISKQG